MLDNRIRCLPVVDDDGKVLGVVDEEDLVHQDAKIKFPSFIHFLDSYIMLPSSLNRFQKELRQAVGAVAHDVMEEEYEAVALTDSVEEVATLMVKKDLEYVLVVEGGKLAFGRKKVRFEKAEQFRWVRDGDRADLHLGEETHRWEDIFSRESDQLILHPNGPTRCDGRELPAGPLRFHYNKVAAGEETIDLDTIAEISGALDSVVIPREAMGFGDVKFLACIGAFLGWQAVLFTLFASSIIGCVFGVAGILIARDKAKAILPFGPYLALGAVLWLFGGRELTDWYLFQFHR
jgi:prepilin signal peptidase PulO-like enzyme (type II secretory pathway)